MIRILTGMFMVALLTACGDDQGAAAPSSAPAAPAANATPAADMSGAAAPAADAAGGDDDSVIYAPIDVSKLDNQWWRQYSAGS